MKPESPKHILAAAGETKWVQPEKYYDQLPGVMKLVPPLPGEDTLYAWINSVFAAAEKDPDTKQSLVDSFMAADKELVAPLTQWKIQRKLRRQRLEFAEEQRAVGQRLPHPAHPGGHAPGAHGVQV